MPLKSCITQFFLDYINKDVAPESSHLCDFNRIEQELQMGDVILVEGRSRISRVIRRVTHSPWTHAALYVGRIHDVDNKRIRDFLAAKYCGHSRDRVIIESIVGEGTQINPLKDYHKDHLRICRANGLMAEDAQRVINHASTHIGREYDLRHVFDLARFYTKHFFIPNRWKSILFSLKPTEVKKDICSVMIAKAFAKIHFPIRPLIRRDTRHKVEAIRRNPRLCTPSDFDYSPYFDIIKYPMMPVYGNKTYKYLPWHEGLISSDEAGISDINNNKKIH